MMQLKNHRYDFAVSGYDLAIEHFLEYLYRQSAPEITTTDVLGFASGPTAGIGQVLQSGLSTFE